MQYDRAVLRSAGLTVGPLQPLIAHHSILLCQCRRPVAGAAAMTGYRSVEPHAGIVSTATSSQMLFDEVADWLLANGY